MADLIPFGTAKYFLFLGLLLFARGMDFLSTWIGTPNLVLEGNPIARRLGWRWGAPLNLALCVAFARWPLPALVIITASLLVAARNLQSAWVARSFGEQSYRVWMAERMSGAPLGLVLFCLGGQTVFLAGLGGGLMAFSGELLVPFAVGMGMITYALAVAIFTLISIWKMKRHCAS